MVTSSVPGDRWTVVIVNSNIKLQTRAMFPFSVCSLIFATIWRTSTCHLINNTNLVRTYGCRRDPSNIIVIVTSKTKCIYAYNYLLKTFSSAFDSIRPMCSTDKLFNCWKSSHYCCFWRCFELNSLVIHTENISELKLFRWIFLCVCAVCVCHSVSWCTVVRKKTVRIIFISSIRVHVLS